VEFFRNVPLLVWLFFWYFGAPEVFPEGIRRLGETNKAMIGWAWGANSFATVLGSILAVIVSINWNFTLVLVLAGVSYLAAGFCSSAAARTKPA
jgi:ABC-type amino acid transport system permease subunit